jgi:hypothetical protein
MTPIRIGTIATPSLTPPSISQLENALKYAIPNKANQNKASHLFGRLEADILMKNVR